MLYEIPMAFSVMICWSPAHIEIARNEVADKAAKEAIKDKENLYSSSRDIRATQVYSG